MTHSHAPPLDHWIRKTSPPIEHQSFTGADVTLCGLVIGTSFTWHELPDTAETFKQCSVCSWVQRKLDV